MPGLNPSQIDYPKPTLSLPQTFIRSFRARQAVLGLG